MKFIFTSLLCLCAMLILSRGQVQAQSAPQNPTIADPHPFDAFYGNLSLADEKARLDNLAAALQHDKEHVAYILLYAGRRACAGETRARAVRMKSYLVKRHGIQPERVVWKDGGHREESTVEFLVWPRSAGEPSVVPTVASSEARIKPCKSKSNDRQVRRNLRKA
jgi:hypothetical protein